MADISAAFMKDIRENPGDDAPRLVYADWLEDNGDPEYAEFIRDQIAGRDAFGLFTRLWGRVWSRSAPPSWRFCGYGVDHEGGESYARFAATPGAIESAFLVWRRGFVAEVRCRLGVWLEHGPALAGLHPLEAVRLTDRAPRRRYGHDAGATPSPRGTYGWYAGATSGGAPDDIPLDLWRALDRSFFQFGSWKLYRAEREAQDALSRALLKLASP